MFVFCGVSIQMQVIMTSIVLLSVPFIKCSKVYKINIYLMNFALYSHPLPLSHFNIAQRPSHLKAMAQPTAHQPNPAMNG
jgi:hypothetical protein